MNLTEDQIEEALPRVSAGLAKYTWLQAELRSRDVSRDSEYQKRFGGFYRVRRNLAWRNAFFQILEQGKVAPIAFEEVLRSIYSATGRVEASFASKLIATLDPSKPVIDSVVLGNLGLRLPAPASSDRFAGVASLHQQLLNLYSKYLASDPGCELVARFRTAYPTAKITEVKMLDFVLWQSRSTA
ncbi:MAG: hypothetical protein HZC50_05960 [Nitrospirae bacterium]|nr:hypothetical protein [Nitrospirota bacterium]